VARPKEVHDAFMDKGLVCRTVSETEDDCSEARSELANRQLPKYVYVKKAKGKSYLYFDTGRKRKSGVRILTRLPSLGSASFARELERARLARWRHETATIPTMAPRPIQVEAFDPAPMREPDSGTDLYFIRAGDAVKIGHAADVFKRMVNMQANNHLELDCICRLRGRGHEERSWHSFFRANHIRGEWFEWTPAMQRAIDLARAGKPWWVE
jgi:hypothetical protein